jgi:AsmA protein
MSKPRKAVLIAIAALLLVAGVAAFLVSRVDIKSRFESAASTATRLEVSVNGNASIGLFPTVHISLRDVIVKNANAQIASVGEADIDVAFWPLLRNQVRIKGLVLRSVDVAIDRDRDGHFNFTQSSEQASQQSSQAERLVPAMTFGPVSMMKATLRYTNREFDKEIKVTDCRFDSNDMELAAGSGADVMKLLSLSARVECAEIRNDLFTGSAAQFTVAGENGIYKLAPVTMQVLGGKGTGSIEADFTGTTPAYRVRYAVAQLHVDNLFNSLDKTGAHNKIGEGFLDFTADLSMRGFNSREMIRTANGEASLRGKAIDIAIGNLDQKLSRYESSQNFNLVDVGAFFIAGPLGTAVTKGFNFASIFQGTEGSTHIGILVSQWKVENGIAHAQDVAMATQENRLAMKGALDFVNREFDAVTVAVLDKKGCAKVEQKVSGPFGKPEIAKPNVLASLAGPIGGVLDRALKLVGAKCAVFYDGSVTP